MSKYSKFRSVTVMVLIGLVGSSVMKTADVRPVSLPDGSSVPRVTSEAVPSVSSPGDVGKPLAFNASSVIGASSPAIPASALSGYQNAARIIDSVDTGCHLEWPLVAAIGKIESDHGRINGNTIGADGVSKPGIYGIPLNGARKTSKIVDTDQGRLDRDTAFDRAVGPVQFIPATWSTMGVDADVDGKRNPQDIDDAALAASVFLCSGKEDLSRKAGLVASILRYNHSADYVNEVLSIMGGYASGDYSTAAGTYAPASGVEFMSAPASPQEHRPNGKSEAKPTGKSGKAKKSARPKGDAPEPTNPPAVEPVKPLPAVPKPIRKALTPLQTATQYCQAHLTGTQINALGGLPTCANAYLKGGRGALDSLLTNLGGVVLGG